MELVVSSSRTYSSCLYLLHRLPLTSIIPYTFPSITCFRRQFLHKMWPPLLPFLLFIVYRIFLSFLTLCNTRTSSILTQSVQLILSIFLEHHTSKLSRYFCYTFRSLEVLAPNKAMLKLQPFTNLFLNFKSNLLAKSLYLFKCFLFHGNPGFNYKCTSCIISNYGTQIVVF